MAACQSCRSNDEDGRIAASANWPATGTACAAPGDFQRPLRFMQIDPVCYRCRAR